MNSQNNLGQTTNMSISVITDKNVSAIPSAVTQPFFELQTPDFAWKFIWTVQTNFEKKIYQGYQKGGSGASRK